MPRSLQVFLCWILLLFPRLGIGDNEVDSLVRVAQSGINEQAALAYKQLAILSVDSLELYIHYGSLGLQIAVKISDDLLSGNLLMNMGVASDMHGQFEDAIQYYDSASLYLVRANQTDWLTTLNINYGSAYYFAGYNHLALDYWLKAYDLSTKDGADENYPVLLNNIAHIYFDLGKYPEAIRYYEESLEFKKEQTSEIRYLNTLRNLARTYQYMGKYEKSLDIYNQARNASIKGNHLDALQIVEFYMADTYLKKGDIDNAEILLRPYWEKGFSGIVDDSKMEGYLIAGEYFMQIGNFQEAIRTLLKARELRVGTKAYADQVRLLENLIDAYSHVGNLSKIVEIQKELLALQKGQMTDSRLSLEQEMQVKFNTLRKEEENIFLREQTHLKDQLLGKSKRNFWLMISLLTIISGFAIHVFLSRKKVNLLVHTLEEQSNQLSKSLAERELLLREIHHRVKNNLQMISSLLSLQSRYVDDPTAFEALQSGQDRVRSMALIHQNLYQDDNLTEVPVKVYFEKLTRNLFDSYNIEPDRISIKLNVEEVHLDVDTIVPLGLIVNELISNALKHAFPDNRPGTVEIYLTQNNKNLLLKIEDDGVGMPSSDFIRKGDSFGYRLVHAFKEQLGADIDIESKKGTCIMLKIHDHRKVS